MDIKRDYNIIIFGIGNFGKKCISFLKSRGFAVSLIVDNNKNLWGEEYQGIRIAPVEDCLKKEYYGHIVILAAFQTKRMIKQLNDLGIENYVNAYEFLTLSDRISVINHKVSDKKVSIVYYDELEEKIEKKLNEWKENNNVIDIHNFKENFIPAGDVILILNIKSKIFPGGLDYLLSAYEENRNCIICSKEITDKGVIIQAGYEVENGKIIASGYREKFCHSKVDYVKKIQYPSLNGILMSREMWEECCKNVEINAELYERIVDFACERQIEFLLQPFSMIVSKTDEWYETAKKYIMTHNVFSVSKKYVAFFDEVIARYDTNAGHRSTHAYLMALREIADNIVYMVDSLQLIDIDYINYYKQKGIWVLYGDDLGNINDKMIREMHNSIVYTFINRPDVAEKYIDTLKTYTQSFVSFYGHDLHHIRLLRQYKIEENNDLLIKSQRYRELEKNIIEKSDISGYPSKEEIRYIKEKFGLENVEYYPLWYYESFPTLNQMENRTGIMFVGGFGHAPNVDAAVWLVREILPFLREYGISDKLYLIGSKPTLEISKLSDDNVIVTGYVSDNELEEYYRKCKVAVIPLRYGAGMKGKVLEAMREGIPVVTTNIGAEGLENVENVISIGNTEDEIAKKTYEIFQISEEDFYRRMTVEQDYIKKNFGKKQFVELIEKQYKLALRRYDEKSSLKCTGIR